MAKAERYARAYYVEDDFEVTVGVEVRPGDDIEVLGSWAKDLAYLAVESHWKHHGKVSSYIEGSIARAYPDRAFFVETERDGLGVQVFQPYGLPRTDAP